MELGEVLKNNHGLIPPRLYLYTDGGNRRITCLSANGSDITVLKHDLDELISAKPAAGYSCRNPVERGHIRKFRFARVGCMGESMDKKWRN